MDVSRGLPLRRKQLALALLCGLGFAGLAEVGLRLAGFAHYPLALPPILWNGDEGHNLNRGTGMMIEDIAQLWVPRPGNEVAYGDVQDERINADGYRGPLLPSSPAAGGLRIVALGDSSTFGFGVPYPDTWCAQLEELLRAQGVRAEVLDAGVIGFTIDQGIERYDALVRGLSPQIVIAAFGAINDARDAPIRPDRPKIDLRKRPRPLRNLLSLMRYRLRLMHVAAWAIDRMRSEVLAAEREELASRLRKHDDLNANSGQPDWPGQRRVGLERFAKALDELDARVRADGARMILISMPRDPAREAESPVLPLYNKAVEDAALRLHARLFDARSAVLTALRGPPEREWSALFLDAYHPSRAGHGLIAAGLAPIVKALAAEPRANSPASDR